MTKKENLTSIYPVSLSYNLYYEVKLIDAQPHDLNKWIQCQSYCYACYITEEDVDHGTSEAVDDFDNNGEMVSIAIGRRWH